jgi:hypothetical protein
MDKAGPRNHPASNRGGSGIYAIPDSNSFTLNKKFVDRSCAIRGPMHQCIEHIQESLFVSVSNYIATYGSPPSHDQLHRARRGFTG